MKPIVIVAPGRTLSAADAELIRASKLPVLVVSNAFRLFQGADYVYHADGRWWSHYLTQVLATAPKRMVTCEAITGSLYGAEGMEWVEHVSGLNTIPPKGTVTGTSSGEHALIFAVNEGYDYIILVGYEYGAAGDGHFDGDHPHGVKAPSNWRVMSQDIAKTGARIAGMGVRVVNCTETTALQCFKRGALKDELEQFIDRPTKTRRSARQEAVE